MKLVSLTSLSRKAQLLTLGFMSLVLVSASLFTGAFAASCSNATDCQQQIDALNALNNQAQGSLNILAAQAGSFQATIAALQDKIDQLQSEINTNQAQQASLEQQITAAQQEIDRQKAILASDVKAMYVDGTPTTIEVLATSKNLSEFVDKQEYRSRVQNKLQETMKKIADLQKQLKVQKVQIDQLLQSLQVQQSQIAQAQAEQNKLLAYNQDQQDQFNGQIAANKSALSQLYAKQAAIIAASFGGGFHYGGSGGYPYADAVCLNGDGNCGGSAGGRFGPYAWGYPPSNEYDGAGWAFRNCTGYAFWRLAQTSGITLTAGLFPSVYASGGRIGYSLPDFRRQGYAVDKNPNGNVVLAVNTGGNFGHIMYVEGVVGGQAVVSQYNGEGRGLYSTGTLTDLGTISFIHIR